MVTSSIPGVNQSLITEHKSRYGERGSPLQNPAGASSSGSSDAVSVQLSTEAQAQTEAEPLNAAQAEELVQSTRRSMLQNPAMAMLAQANQASQQLQALFI